MAVANIEHTAKSCARDVKGLQTSRAAYYVTQVTWKRQLRPFLQLVLQSEYLQAVKRSTET